MDAIPKRFSNYSRDLEELKTNFSAVGSFLEYMSMIFFSNGTYCLGSKMRQREGGDHHHPTDQKFINFHNHEDDIKS